MPVTSIPYPLLDALKEAVGFEPLGEPAANVTVGRGRFDGRPVHVALVENRGASGSIGAVEVKRLAALLQIVARERSPLVLFLDSAGAKVSEGLRALGAFRHVYREGLGAALAGAPIAAILGRNCYGGSSMLAHLAHHRLFGPGTQLAMSGPSILAATAGMNVLDEMFRAMAEASISASSRARASGANRVFDDNISVSEWLRESLAPQANPAATFRARHEALGERLATHRAANVWEPVRRRDLDKLYPGGYETREASGLIEGRGQAPDGEERIVGIVGKAPLGTERAWRFADAGWSLLASPPPRLRVLLDCATHAGRLEDERIVLSEYIVGMSLPLALLAAKGTRVELTIVGEAGGGVYVALAGPATHVSAVHGARIRVLPGSALTAILGEAGEETSSPLEYQAAGVAEEELRLGIVQAR
jgi:hypothetical protein